MMTRRCHACIAQQGKHAGGYHATIPGRACGFSGSKSEPGVSVSVGLGVDVRHVGLPKATAMDERANVFGPDRIVARYVIIAAVVVVISAGVWGLYLYDTWNQVRRESMRAQSRIENIIDEQNISGFARVLYYFNRVDFVGEGFGKEEILGMKDVCKEFEWIKGVKISGASLSAEDLTEIRREFDPIVVWIREEAY
ncbi:hypothetical protein [Rubinisphaera sp. JC750]|uniref:hypothetical protein n=1 Tax=Rubinisphaera sp. JC750 TaxID=2898658 RepID=UPI001F3FD459|nr:hypothetical protein [Rubinisphaera sp. JC750]